MAIKKGTYTVGVKTGGVNIPKQETSLESIGKEFSNMADAVFNVVQKKQEANFLYSFTDDVNKNYSKFRTDFQYDPAGLRSAAETYAKTKIENVPLAYKAYATKYLAGQNASAINYATTQKIAKDDAIFDANYSMKKDNIGSMVTVGTEPILNNIELGTNQKVNDIAANFNSNIAPNINSVFATAINAKPKNALKYQTDYTTKLKDSVSILLANQMIAYGTQTKGAFDVSKNFMSSGNLFRNIKPEDLNQTTKDAISLSKDLINRKEINTKALNLYAEYRNKSLDKLRTDAGGDLTFKFAAAKNKEVGSITHLGTAKLRKNEFSNINEIINKDFSGLSSTQTQSTVKLLNDTKIRLERVENAINGKDTVNKYTEDEKSELADDILQYYNINDVNVLLDPNNKAGGPILDLFKKLNYIPTVMKQYLAPESMNIESDDFQKQFINRLNVYKRIGNEGDIDVGGNNTGLYEIAIQNGWESLSTQNLRERVKAWRNPTKPLKEKYTELNTKLNGKESDLDNFIRDEMTNLEGSRFFLNVAGKFLVDEALESIGIDIIETRGERETKLGVRSIGTEGILGKNVNVIPDFGQFEYPKDLVFKVTELTKDNFLAMNPSNLDMTDKDNKKLVKLALKKSIKQLDKLNYGFTKYHSDFENKNTYKYQPHPFEKSNPEVSDREVRLEALGMFNAWVNTIPKGERNQYYGSDEKGNVYDYDFMRKHILTSKNSIILQAVAGTADENGKPRYRLYIKNPNGDTIPVQKQNEYFSASKGWLSSPETKLPATISNIKMVAAKAALDDFKKEYGQYINKDNEKIVERAFYGWEKFRIASSNFSLFVTDVPFKDTPAEFKPFKYLFNLMGKDIDYEKEKNKLAKIERTMLDNMDKGNKVLASMQGNSIEKTLEAAFPPHKTPMTDYNTNMRFKLFVENNYNKTTMPLNIRTNNYTGIVSNPNQIYNGQLKYKSGNTLTFARPSDSYEATIHSMYAKSTLSKLNVDKDYGDHPTVTDIAKSYGINKSDFYNILQKDFGLLKEDKINLLKFEDVRKVMLAITKHQMGNDVYNQYYGDNQLMLNRFIKEGFDRAKEQMDFE